MDFFQDHHTVPVRVLQQDKTHKVLIKQEKDNSFIKRKKKAMVNGDHSCSLAESLPKKKKKKKKKKRRSLCPSCWALLSLQGMRAATSGLPVLFSGVFCLLIFFYKSCKQYFVQNFPPHNQFYQAILTFSRKEKMSSIQSH